MSALLHDINKISEINTDKLKKTDSFNGVSLIKKNATSIRILTKALEVSVLGKTTFSFPVYNYDNKKYDIRFARPRFVKLYFSREHLAIDDKELGILVWKKNDSSAKKYDNIVDELHAEYFNYFINLYETYVINKDGEKLSTHALELKKRLEGIIGSGKFKSKRN